MYIYIYIYNMNLIDLYRVGSHKPILKISAFACPETAHHLEKAWGQGGDQVPKRSDLERRLSFIKLRATIAQVQSRVLLFESPDSWQSLSDPLDGANVISTAARRGEMQLRMIWKHTGSRTLDWSAYCCFWLLQKENTKHHKAHFIPDWNASSCMMIRHILSLTVTIRGELPSPPGPDPVRRGVTRGVTFHAFSILLLSFLIFFGRVILLGSAGFCSVLRRCRRLQPKLLVMETWMLAALLWMLVKY